MTNTNIDNLESKSKGLSFKAKSWDWVCHYRLPALGSEQLPLESKPPDPRGHGGGGHGAGGEVSSGEGEASGGLVVSHSLLESLSKELGSLGERGLGVHEAGNLLLSAGGVSRVQDVSSDNKDLGAGREVKNNSNH